MSINSVSKVRVDRPTAETDPQRQRTVFLRFICFGFVIICIPSALSVLFSFEGSTADYVFSTALTFLSVIGIIGLLLLRRRRVLLTTRLVVAAIAITTALVMLPFGINHVGVLLLILPLVLAATLLNRTEVTITFLFITFAAIGSQYLEYFDVIKTVRFVPVGAENFVPAITLIVIFAAVAGILNLVNFQQRNTQVEIGRGIRNLQTLTTLIQIINRQDNRNKLLSSTIDALRDQFGYYFVEVYLVEPQANLLVRYALTRIGRDSISERRLNLTDERNIIVRALRVGRLLQIMADEPEAMRTEFLPATRVQLLVPLTRDGQPFGVLNIHSTSEQPASDFERSAIEAVAAQLSVALKAIAQVEEVRALNAERLRLVDQNTKLTRDNERLTRDSTGRNWTRYLSERAGSMVGYDWQAGKVEPADEEDTTITRYYEDVMPSVHPDGDQFILGVPILLRGRAIGAMEFRSPPGVPWDNRSLELARTVSQRLSLTLENIRLFEQAQMNASREQVINQVSARLQTKNNLDALLQEAAESFSEAVGATKTRIQLISPEQMLEQN